MERKPYAIYTRYPEGIGGETAEDLICPNCGSDQLEIVEEQTCFTSDYGMLGDVMRCWVCKREFTVTGNCWKFREKKAWS